MLPSKQITLGYVVSGTGWVLFALGLIGMLGESLSPRGSEHAYIFFRNVGWLVTCGWLLQFYETSEKLSGLRYRMALFGNAAKEYVAPVLVSAIVLFFIVFTFLLSMGTD